MSKIKKYGIIITTVITVFASSLIVTKAAGTQVSIRSVEIDSNSDNVYVISVEFADYTSGTLVLTINGTLNRNILPIGARLSNIYNTSGSTGSGRYTFQVDDCKQFLIYCFPNSTTGTTYSPYATVYSNDTSYVEHVNQSFIESQFTTTNGYIDDLESTCNNIYTEVHNIYLMLVDEANDLDNIQSQLTTLGNYISTTNTSLELIRQTIALTNQSLSSIISGINEINDANYNIPYESLMAYAFFRELATAGIQTLDGYYAPYYAITSLSKSNVLLRTGYTYYLSYMVNRTNSGFLQSIQTSGGTSANYSVVDGLPLINGIRVITYQITVTTQDYYTFTFQDVLSGVYVIPLYYGNGENISDQMKSITGINTLSDEAEKLQAIYTWLSNFTQIDYTDQLDDIYTWLTNYSQIDYTNQLDQVIDAINGLQPDTDTTTNITNFNTNMDNITDIENDFSVDFGNRDTTFKNTESSRWSFDTNKQTPVNALHDVFTQVVFMVPEGRIWLSIVLLGAVLITLLG